MNSEKINKHTSDVFDYKWMHSIVYAMWIRSA